MKMQAPQLLAICSLSLASACTHSPGIEACLQQGQLWGQLGAQHGLQAGMAWGLGRNNPCLPAPVDVRLLTLLLPSSAAQPLHCLHWPWR